MKSLIKPLLAILLLGLAGPISSANSGEESGNSYNQLRAEYERAGQQNGADILSVIGKKRLFQNCKTEINEEIPTYALMLNTFRGHSFTKNKSLATEPIKMNSNYELVVKDMRGKYFSVNLYQDDQKVWNKIDYLRVLRENGSTKLVIETTIEIMKSVTGTVIPTTQISIEDERYMVYGYTSCDVSESVEAFY